MKADLFVPCGGRPKSINLTNWRSLLGRDGKPLFRWIVEGANLFIAQEARRKLEAEGVILFKDSSTNKGGVISSSLEVLAGLALTDNEYDSLMSVKPGGRVPAFRRLYIEQAIASIRRTADLERDLLWRTHAAGGVPLCELSEAVSGQINDITTSIERSALFDDDAVRRSALRMTVPTVLIERLGMETLIGRLPQRYLRALFARSIASAFVYRFGVEAGFEDYRLFIEELAAQGR